MDSSITGRMEAETLHARLISNASVNRGRRKPLGGRRRIELRSTGPFRSTLGKYLLSDSRPFPVATKDDMCPPNSNHPVAALATTLFVRLVWVGAGLYGPFRPVSHGQAENRRELATRIEQPSPLEEKRSARILNRNGRAGRGMGMGFSKRSEEWRSAPLYKNMRWRHSSSSGARELRLAPKNRTRDVPLAKSPARGI